MYPEIGVAIRKTGSGNPADPASLDVYRIWHQFAGSDHRIRCGVTCTELHYTTECALTVSWHMKNTEPNFEQEWLERVANNLVSRHEILRIVKFISENRDLSRPPSPFRPGV
ncbi:hypothetical protein AVEN_194984-1 [Araneus ventricosus]|uniref:Uncharacterized protein n=1 Tax=Araneus ventricosus TaxID=182803 RepID=A0A4Y2QAE8_ARAVE|nr:hypothetical protein AVEN_54891-1 [Araneus ventricosus]GBN65194.1 hypothetical protein AVEN_194984-1 [Araneus ventricosus]